MKSTTKYLLVFCLLGLTIASGSDLFAQPGRGGVEQQGRGDEQMRAIQSRRIGYITEKLSLSRTTARTFWPIYFEYTQKVEELAGNFKQLTDSLPDANKMNEVEAKIWVEAELTRFEEAARLRRVYTEKMLEVITMRQVALLFESESGFNRMLFREAQRGHGGGRQ